MFQRLTRALFVLPVIAACLSCAFADLRPIGIDTVPGGPWALLPEEDSPVVLRFDTEMEKSSVEYALQLYSPMGVSDGELNWEENKLYFYPSVPWKAGIRYGLRLSGTVIALDGRELLLSTDIPFYAVSRSPLPYVISFTPPDGGSVGVSPSNILELNFSLPMDRRVTEDALKLETGGEKVFEWLDDDKTLRVSSDKPLNPWAVYRWSLPEKAMSRDGAPLVKEISGRFVADLDREFPRVLRVLPLMPPESVTAPISPAAGLWGAWLPAGISMTPGPGPGQGIGVEFSKPVESDSLRRAFGFTPSLPGRVEILSPVSAVYIPTKDPIPGVTYSLRISGALKDIDGLKMGEDYTINFKSDVPFLFVNSIFFADNPGNVENLPPETGSLFQVPVYTGGIVRCIINFSVNFDTENPAVQEECAFRISLQPFFPGALPPVSLRGARWIKPDRLLLEWEGPEKGKPGVPHYYRLIFPGGSGGIHNGMGSYLKEDLVLYLEAEL